ncbi:type II secretion system protein [Bacillus sp. REN10]|uniref:type II secretion system protein n=1 Tax=Bacillus sp. REN10 TaxID=2782541 RepID=UPI00193B48C7|nr:type II secretion system protein [Bacillus sp. REN10]
MWKNNEQGFSLAESLLSFSAILIVTIFILPLLLQMIGQSKALWEREKAMRVLFEEGEKYFQEDVDFTYVYVEEGEQYQVSWEAKTAACVEVSGKSFCIQQQ